MPRSSKLLASLALPALIALVGCASAGAAVFQAQELPATVNGEFAGGLAFMTEGGELNCTTEVDGTLSKVSESLALTPTFSNCKAFGFSEATVNPEGCQFVLHTGEETGEDEYALTTDVSCASGKSIKVATATCSLEIGTQSGLSSATANSETQSFPENFTLEEAITKVVYTVTKDSFLCPFSGTGKKEGGKFENDATLTASGPVLEQIGFAVAEADVGPSPFNFTGPTQSTIGTLVLFESRPYEIWGQFLEAGTEFELKVSSMKSCPNPTTPELGFPKPCDFVIEAKNPPVGGTDVLVTQWSPQGAMFPRVIRTTVRRTK